MTESKWKYVLEKLGTDNESVQLQVCSDYNFHSEESFKINYWVKVIEVLMDDDGACVSANSIRDWWRTIVNPNRRLPGLEKVLKAAVRDKSKGLVTLSHFKHRYDVLWSPNSAPARSGSIVTKTAGVLGSLARGIWSYTWGLPEDNTIEEDGIDSDEILLLLNNLEKYGIRFQKKTTLV